MSRYTLVRFIGASAVIAALVHIAEFHLGLSGDGSLWTRAAWAAAMLLHCPVLPWLALGGTLGLAAATRGDRRLLTNLALIRQAGGSRSAIRHSASREPIQLAHLAGFAIALAVTQWLLFTALMQWMPMAYEMKMHGAWMAMVVSPALPILPVCVVVGLFGGVVLSLFERTVRAIAAIAAELQRPVFAVVASLLAAAPPPEPKPVSSRFGPALFSRPPPCALAPAS